jgi:hypothetical protein
VQEIACFLEYLTTRWASLLREASVIVPEEPKEGDDVRTHHAWKGAFERICTLPVSCKGIVLIPYETSYI